MDVIDRWEKSTHDIRPTYRRDLRVGPLSLSISVWPANDDCSEWYYGFQGGRADVSISKKSPEAAMNAAEVVLAGYLRQAARQVQPIKDHSNG